MAVFYPRYDIEIATWIRAQSDIYVQVYAACMQRQQFCDTADNSARKAVADYIEKFPEPKWPGDEEDE